MFAPLMLSFDLLDDQKLDQEVVKGLQSTFSCDIKALMLLLPPAEVAAGMARKFTIAEIVEIFEVRRLVSSD
eukprot:s939_g5.t1